MNPATKIATTAGAFVAAGVAAKLLNNRQTERRRLRRGEDVPFGSVHSASQKVVSTDGIRINVEVDEPELEAPHLPTIVFVQVIQRGRRHRGDIRVEKRPHDRKRLTRWLERRLLQPRIPG